MRRWNHHRGTMVHAKAATRTGKGPSPGRRHPSGVPEGDGRRRLERANPPRPRTAPIVRWQSISTSMPARPASTLVTRSQSMVNRNHANTEGDGGALVAGWTMPTARCWCTRSPPKLWTRKTTLSPKDAHAPVRIRMMNTATVASSKTGRVVTMRWLAAMTVALPPAAHAAPEVDFKHAEARSCSRRPTHRGPLTALRSRGQRGWRRTASASACPTGCLPEGGVWVRERPHAEPGMASSSNGGPPRSAWTSTRRAARRPVSHATRAADSFFLTPRDAVEHVREVDLPSAVLQDHRTLERSEQFRGHPWSNDAIALDRGPRFRRPPPVCPLRQRCHGRSMPRSSARPFAEPSPTNRPRSKSSKRSTTPSSWCRWCEKSPR